MELHSMPGTTLWFSLNGKVPNSMKPDYLEQNRNVKNNVKSVANIFVATGDRV